MFIIAIKTKCQIPKNLNKYAHCVYDDLKNCKSNGDSYGYGFDKVVEFHGWDYDYNEELEELEKNSLIREIERIYDY